MNSWQNYAQLPNGFNGIVRLFPLPNLVLFPHVIQMLHIFEPRYCDLLEDATRKDHLIAMAMMQPGWEADYLFRPALDEVVCIGKIVSHTPTDDGHHNVMLLGQYRARILRELPFVETYRTAEVEILSDFYPTEGEACRAACHERLIQLFLATTSNAEMTELNLTLLRDVQIPLGILTDVIGYALKLPPRVKSQLLSVVNVDHRCRLLIQCLEQMASMRDSSSDLPNDLTGEEVIEIGPSFPPQFSQN